MTVKRMLLIMVVFLFSCRDKNNIPKDILPPAKMELVLFDVLRADNLVFEYIKKDSAKKPEEEIAKLQRQIFAVHKISREDFYKSYEFYKVHPDIMQPMLDSMISVANRNKYQNTFGKPKNTKDSLKMELHE